jgi:hypothetical protein
MERPVRSQRAELLPLSSSLDPVHGAQQLDYSTLAGLDAVT